MPNVYSYRRAARRRRYDDEQILIRKRRRQGVFRAGGAQPAPGSITPVDILGIGIGSTRSMEWMENRTGQQFGIPAENAIVGTLEALWKWANGMWQVIEIFR